MKKKLISIGLSLLMFGSMLAGCGNAGAGNSSAGNSSAASASSGQVAATSDEPIKIGVSIWSSTDVLGSQCKLILDEFTLDYWM